MNASAPVAIITGGSSGIGSALARYLVSARWIVVIADLHPPEIDIPSTVFIQTDISSWQQQLEMFQQVDARYHRLDFCALNAGIDDQDDILEGLDYNWNSEYQIRQLSQPDTTPIAVNLVGTYYGIQLASHFMSIPRFEAGKSAPGGKIVITSSGTGLYPSPCLPQYSATKAGLIALVRALASNHTLIAANIQINAVCPGIVASKFAPPLLIEKLPSNQITPVETIIRCFEQLAELQSGFEKDWEYRGQSGQILEGNGTSLIFHDALLSQRVSAGGLDRETSAKVVAEAYRAHRQNIAAQKDGTSL